ncbi:lipase family protein [Microbacterium sp. SORGH_AS_0888]|uniref:lipase family protein n=1 Tax=Microbacterium sp. SORGH_AS_0888 TaxID=3041791 RepID=UPI0027867FD7|nr:lipase family protein [Microbacterium sp. SORGH_AS_0888]MDQ1128338.1 alpha-beta hydrolase superfamily lysophospholipase/uncharacterized membrane protein HdeD (DUF308 family) [Microbacterium sp. SORGH_AS_0888]
MRRLLGMPHRGLSGALGAILCLAAVLCAPRPLTTLVAVLWVLCAATALWACAHVASNRARPRAWMLAVSACMGAVAAVVFTPAVIRAYPALLAVGLVGVAARLLARAVRRRATDGASRAGAAVDRIAHAVRGAAALVAAVLVLLWPDVALLLLSWGLVGAAGVTGLVLLSRAVRPRRTPREPLRAGARRGLRVTAAVLIASLAVIAAVGSGWAFGRVASVPDFYAWSDDVPASPGELLRAEPYDGEAPSGAQALRILYSTSRTDGSAAIASAVVAFPAADPPAEGRPVIAWQHGTTGVAQPCAPSLGSSALSEYSVPGISRMIARGWAVVATDYPGMGTAGRYPYLIGEGEGRSTLDGVRALRQLPEAHASVRTHLWGHSQGGHATLWAAQIAQQYAPELEIVDVAALSSASDPLELARRVTTSASRPIATTISAYVLVPYADEYPDLTVTGFTHPAGSTFVRAGASRCLLDPGTVVTLLVGFGIGRADALYDFDLDAGPVHDRLTENIATGIVPAPLFLGQGSADEVVPVTMQRQTTARACAAGRPVVTHEYDGLGHMGVVAPGAAMIDDLFAWSDAVSAGSVPTTCPGQRPDHL